MTRADYRHPRTPNKHDRTKKPSYHSSTETLYQKQYQDDKQYNWYGLQMRVKNIKPFYGGGDGDGRRDHAIGKQRGPAQHGGKHHPLSMLTHQGIKRQD